MPEKEQISPTEQARRDLERLDMFWKPWHEAMDEEDAFRDGDCYEDNEDFYNRDRRMIQVKGEEINDAIRHMVAGWSTKPRNLISRPIDAKGDKAAGDVFTALVNYELRDPLKGFEDELYAAIMASQEHRLGILWMDYLTPKECPPWGDLFYSEEDARNFMWDPAYMRPHHPLCSVLARTKRVQVDLAREMYGVDWLEPDHYVKNSRYGNPDRPLVQGRMGPSPQAYEDDKVTISQVWYKKDKSKKYRDKKDGKDLRLPKEQRYMSCAGQCGYRSPRQGEAQMELPEEMPESCPTCGGDLERIDSLGEQEAIYAYSRGKRLLIVAPHQNTEESLYDDKWPVTQARSFPGMFIRCDVRPGRPMGGSVVSRLWDLQVAANQLDNLSLQRVFEHRNLFVLPEVGLNDRNGRRWENRDDQSNVMFKNAAVEQQWGPLAVQLVNGTGLDPEFAMVRANINQRLNQFKGIADFGLTEENSKAIPASTVAQITKQEDLPLADFTKRTRRELGIFCGILADYIIATYPPQRLVRLSIEGTDMVLPVWGQDMPGMDFEIEDTPEFSGQEKAKAETWQALEEVFARYMQMGIPFEAIAGLIEVYAQEMHLTPSSVQKFLEAMGAIGEAQQAMQQQQAMAAQAQQQTMEDEADADMEAGLDVPGMPPEMNPEAMGAETPALSQ